MKRMIVKAVVIKIVSMYRKWASKIEKRDAT